MVSVLVIFIGLSLAVFGSIGTYLYYRKKELYNALTRTDATNPSQVTEGIVEVTGTVAEPIDGDIETTMSDYDNPVATGWKIEEWEETEHSSYWNPIAQGVQTTPFKLKGGSRPVEVALDSKNTAGDESVISVATSLEGSAASKNGVQADNFVAEFDRLSILTETTTGEEPPSDIKRFLDQFREIDAVSDKRFGEILDFGRKEGTRRYAEAGIEVGDTVYVRGKATQKNSGWGDAAYTIEEPEDGYAVISNMSEDRVEARFDNSDRYFKLSAVATVIGVVLTLVGLFL